MPRRHFVSLLTSTCAAAYVALRAHVAVAETPSATRLRSIRSDGAESCPEEAQLRSAVVAHLGWNAFVAGATTETEVTWWRDARGRLASRVVRRDDSGAPLGERTLESGATTCAELAAATAFAIAVAIDPALAAREPGVALAPVEPSPTSPPLASPAPAPAPAPVPPPPATAVSTTPPAASPAPASSALPVRDRAFVPFVGAGAHAGLLSAPAVVPGGSMHVGLRVGFLSLAGEARFDGEGRGADDGAVGEVGTTLALGMLAPCVHLDPVAFCAVGGVGALGAEGYDVDRPETDRAVIGVLGARIAAELPILRQRLGVFVQGDALVGVPRATVELDGAPAFEASPVHVTLGGGLRLHLGKRTQQLDPDPVREKEQASGWR